MHRSARPANSKTSKSHVIRGAVEMPPKSRKLSEPKQPSTPRSLPATPIDAPRIDYSVEELKDLDKTELINKLLKVQSFVLSILSKLDTLDALTSKVDSMANDVERNIRR